MLLYKTLIHPHMHGVHSDSYFTSHELFILDLSSYIPPERRQVVLVSVTYRSIRQFNHSITKINQGTTLHGQFGLHDNEASKHFWFNDRVKLSENTYKCFFTLNIFY